MNILFVNYGDFTTNSLTHIAGFASVLRERGCACVVAVPTGRSTLRVIPQPRFTPATYEELLANPGPFPDGGPADIIHAWTPRESVRKFVLAYQRLARARLIVHLEDNEEHLVAAWAGRPIETLRRQLDAERAATLPDFLSHPVRHRNLLYLADGVTVVIDSLRRFVPAGPPVHVLTPGVYFKEYRPRPADAGLRRELGLREGEKVIVFPGSVTFANQGEIRDLYRAVQLLQEGGAAVRLVRTGITPPEFQEEAVAAFPGVALELGFVDRARLPGLLALADVLVQPGRPGAFNDYRLPAKLPEFLALGKPVVLPAANIAAEMQDGREALLLRDGSPEEIAAACRRVFADPALAENLGGNALEFARARFDLAANGAGLAAFYETVASGAARTDWSGATASPATDVPLLADRLRRELAALPAAVELAALADDLALLCRQLDADASGTAGEGALARLERERAELQRQLDATAEHAASLALVRAKLESELTQANYQLTETRARALALGEKFSELRDLLRETIRQREDRIFQREEKIRRMEASISWRVTAPLRFLRRKLVDPRRRPPLGPVSAPAYDFSAVPEAQSAFRPGDFQPPSAEFDFSVDYPSLWSFQPRPLALRGWCLSSARRALRSVRAVVDGRVYTGTYGLKRMDVLATYRDHPQAEYCGFKIDAELLQDDAELVLEAGDENGGWHRFFHTPLHVDRESGQLDPSTYDDWIKIYDHHTPESLKTLTVHAGTFVHPPRISVLMPVYNTPRKWLARAVESVIGQAYPHWQLCIADDASTQPHVRPLLEQYAAADPRIKVVFRERNGHISAASNSALELATGEWIALLDSDDELAPHALYEVAALLIARRDTDLVYSDEDKIDAGGRRREPYFKPDFQPDLFTGQNYVSHLAVYRAGILREIGGFRIGFEGSQDWDLTLRFVERTTPERIRHIPKVLYHWRAIVGSTAFRNTEKDYHAEPSRRALAEHFTRRGETVEIMPVSGGHWRVKYARPAPAPLVSIIIPTRNSLDLIRRCIDSILEKTTYPNYEIVVIDNGSDDPATLEYLQQVERVDPNALEPLGDERFHPVRVLRHPPPFNYSAINNFAVREARGAIIGLLNNDLEVINGDWLDEMASQAARPAIGCVGAKMYYPNDTIQHAGVVLGVGGVAGHAFRDFSREADGWFNRARLAQNYSAVTGACLVIRKPVYEEVGGLDEKDLAVAYNDIDFCLKVRAAGYRNLWTPFAEFYHHESASRGADDTHEKRERFRHESDTMFARWGRELKQDPAYNPNLTLELNDFSLAVPPRPWSP